MNLKQMDQRLKKIGEKAEKYYADPFGVSRADLVFLLHCLNHGHADRVYGLADHIRRTFMGDTIFIRCINEFSNHCRRSCAYCGINSQNIFAIRYRMTEDEILQACHVIARQGHKTVVLQSGEDLFFNRDRMSRILKRIKLETDLAITLSVGERDADTYRSWQEAGMDRYLLRFETTNRKIFSELHPDDDYDQRVECIRVLKSLGVQTGSGFMIGLPGTGEVDLINDVLFSRDLDLDMIGIGPFIPHPETPLSVFRNQMDLDYLTGVIALLRIVNPDAHIPATTAFDAIEPHKGRQLTLQRGANVYMPNCTPLKFRSYYLLYPDKPNVDESPEESMQAAIARATAIDRTIGKGHGHSIHRSVYSSTCME